MLIVDALICEKPVSLALGAAVTVMAMLLAGVLAKLDGARFGLYVIVALCLFHVVMAIRRDAIRRLRSWTLWKSCWRA